MLEGHIIQGTYQKGRTIYFWSTSPVLETSIETGEKEGVSYELERYSGLSR